MHLTTEAIEGLAALLTNWASRRWNGYLACWRDEVESAAWLAVAKANDHYGADAAPAEGTWRPTVAYYAYGMLVVDLRTAGILPARVSGEVLRPMSNAQYVPTWLGEGEYPAWRDALGREDGRLVALEDLDRLDCVTPADYNALSDYGIMTKADARKAFRAARSDAEARYAMN